MQRPAYETVNLSEQSVLISDRGRSGGWIRRSPITATYYDGVTTTWENFLRSVTIFPNNPCYGVKYRRPDAGASFGAFEWLTYKQVYDQVREVSAGLAVLGLCRQQTIAIWSKNSLPWMLIDLAACSRSLVTVAIYDTFGPAVVEYVLQHAEISVICCADVAQARVILQLAARLPQLRHLVILSSDVPAELRVEADGLLQLLSLADIMALGKRCLSAQRYPAADPPKPTDVAVLMYTSGTTGMPKAVMQTHANVIATCSAIQSYIRLSSTDCYLSYLPLAHIFERCAMAAFLGAGAAIGFSRGIITKLVDDIGELKPTIFIGVPRVFDRILQGVRDKLSQESSFKQWLFNCAFESKKESGKSSFWDAVVFRKTRERLGGRVRMIVSGGAPLSANTQQFIQVCFCCPVLQGYGLSESTSGGTLSNPRDTSLSHVGPPLPSVEIKLVDVPEMNYLTSHQPPTGEVWIRGPCVSPGYYKDPELTASDFSDGWFKTGDVARWNTNGTLSIIDRKKNIFKLSIGEYIAAEHLEGIYAKSPFISQIWIYGDSLKASIVAIVVPSRNVITKWSLENGIQGSFEALCTNALVNKAILDDLTGVGKTARLQSFELLRGIHLHPREFTVEEDFLTPTMKLKRAPLRKAFQNQIDGMYAAL